MCWILTAVLYLQEKSYLCSFYKWGLSGGKKCPNNLVSNLCKGKSFKISDQCKQITFFEMEIFSWNCIMQRRHAVAFIPGLKARSFLHTFIKSTRTVSQDWQDWCVSGCLKVLYSISPQSTTIAIPVIVSAKKTTCKQLANINRNCHLTLFFRNR